MKRLLSVLVFMSMTLSASEITIAVAANVSYAMDELKEAFQKKNPQIDVKVIVGGSGKLTAQIRSGAPYGLFMSANMIYPQALYDDKIATTLPLVYAEGALAFLSVKKLDLSQGMQLLTNEKIKKIAIANPKTAPYGKAAVEAMKHAKVYDEVQSKFVYGESISQTVSYTVMAADIGIIAKSALYSPRMRQYREESHWLSVDASLYEPIKQGIVLLKFAQNSAEYRAFYDFILSQQAKAILKKYGYIVS